MELSIDNLKWENLEPYLRKARGQSHNSVMNHKSRFNVMKNWFVGKQFDTKNFSIFLSEVEELGKSASYQNNCLKLAKHIVHYLGKPHEFEGFKYANEGDSTPEVVLTPKQITQLAECKIKYIRFKNRKVKHNALILFLGNVGSRIDETLKLEWRDLLISPIPMIHFRAEITKTKRERFCPIPKWLYKTLLNLPRENNYVFSKIEASNFRMDLKNRCKIVGITDHVTPHVFRDSSINNKLTYGMPLEQVASYHGHIKIDTTFKFYVRIKAAQLAQSLYNFDPSFKNDQTYEICAQAAKENVERVINQNIINYDYISQLNEFGKKEIIIRLVEK